jgi:hypothetical protein
MCHNFCRLTARVSGLVGEPANETEKCFRLDSSIFARPTTKSAARRVGQRVFRIKERKQHKEL